MHSCPDDFGRPAQNFQLGPDSPPPLRRTASIKAGEGGGQGDKIPGARAGLGARNLDKTSGHCATVKRVGGP